MLALIGLKKFRSFQKPNKIARTLNKRKGPGIGVLEKIENLIL